MMPFNGEDASYTTFSSSSTSSSSSSSSPSPFSPSKTMEEVWKDINLSSLHHHSSRAAAAAGINFQDFLARPFANEQPPPSAAAAAAVPTPDTMLNLNSVVPDLHFPAGSVVNVGTTTCFEALALNNANGLGARNSRLVNSDDNSGDRRHKRMIKNRESAARSRARKQAYTNQLEQEVSHLTEENCRLKKQLQQLRSVAAVAGGVPHHPQLKKGSLSRTSTAPF